MIVKRFILRSIAIAGIICFLNSCKKENTNSIPNAFVDIYIYTTDPSFNNLNSIGGWEYVTGGSRGILISRTSINEFVAFERHCPYNPSDPCGQVEIDSSSAILLIDPCCSSSFLLNDGSVVNGASTAPLRRYQTTFDGIVLHIFN